MVELLLFCAFAAWMIEKKVFEKPSKIRWLIGTAITFALALVLRQWFWGVIHPFFYWYFLRRFFRSSSRLTPTIFSTGLPSWNRIIVGIDLILNALGICGSLSTLCFMILTFVPISFARSSRMGQTTDKDHTMAPRNLWARVLRQHRERNYCQ